MKNIFLHTFICTLFVSRVENAKILCLFPLPLPSHFAMYKVIFQELASRGHEVDVYTSFKTEKNDTGLTYIVVDRLPFYDRPLTLQYLRSLSVGGNLDSMFHGRDKNVPYNVCQKLFEPIQIKALKDSKKKYDLLMIEVFIADCMFGFAHVFNAPVVALTSSVDLPWGTSRIGNPDNPSYIPTYFRDILPKMNLYDRMVNTFTLVYTKLMHKYYLITQNREARLFFGDDIPSLDDLVSNSSLFILNSHFTINQARPNLPNVIEAAGIHIKKPESIDEKLQKFLGNSKFIYFSLGSLFSAEVLPIESLQNICAVLSELEYKVIWKIDRSKLPKQIVLSENIYAEKWLNQIDILCHPNILFFMTHNGLLGTLEAVYCGVPMLGTPLFADQFLNTKNMVQKGIAIEIDLEVVTKELFRAAIAELVTNASFKHNAKKLSQEFKDRPNEPLQEVTYWIEYVIKYRGAPQLRSRSVDLTWYQYYLLDIALIVFMGIATTIGTCLMISKFCMCLFSNRINTKTKVE